MHYKYFGLFAFTLLLLGLAFIAIRWPQNKSMTFSQHVAKHKSAIFYYILLFALTLPILLLFFFKWFIPEFKTPWIFGFLVTLSAVTQLACTFVPETGGLKSKYHRALAGISAALLVPVLVSLLFAVTIDFTSKIIIVTSLSVMITVIYSVAKNKGTHKNFLTLQSIFFLVFFVSIFVVSY